MSEANTTTPSDKVSNAKAKFAKGTKPKKAAKAAKPAKAKKAKAPAGPRKAIPNGTGDTMKFQANGPTDWRKKFQAIVGKDGKLGEGVRACLAYALDHVDAVKAHAAKLAKAAEKE